MRESDVLDLDASELLRECREEARRQNLSFYHYISYTCRKAKRLGITDREETLLQTWLMKKISKREPTGESEAGR